MAGRDHPPSGVRRERLDVDGGPRRTSTRSCHGEQGQVFPLAWEGHGLGRGGRTGTGIGGRGSQAGATSGCSAVATRTGLWWSRRRWPSSSTCISPSTRASRRRPRSFAGSLQKALRAFGERRLSELRSPAIAAWRMTIPVRAPLRGDPGAPGRCSPARRFPGVTRVHARSLATEFRLQIGGIGAPGICRETSRVVADLPALVRARSPRRRQVRCCSRGR